MGQYITYLGGSTREQLGGIWKWHWKCLAVILTNQNGARYYIVRREYKRPAWRNMEMALEMSSRDTNQSKWGKISHSQEGV